MKTTIKPAFWGLPSEQLQPDLATWCLARCPPPTSSVLTLNGAEEVCVGLGQDGIWPSCFQRSHQKLNRLKSRSANCLLGSEPARCVACLCQEPRWGSSWHPTDLCNVDQMPGPTEQARRHLWLPGFLPFLWFLRLP